MAKAKPYSSVPRTMTINIISSVTSYQYGTVSFSHVPAAYMGIGKCRIPGCSNAQKVIHIYALGMPGYQYPLAWNMNYQRTVESRSVISYSHAEHMRQTGAFINAFKTELYQLY